MPNFFSKNLKLATNLFQKSLQNWSKDNASDLAAALAYYALFALTPMILVILTVIGAVYSNDGVRSDLLAQIGSNFDQSTVQSLEAILKNLEDKQAQGIARFFGLILLFFAASGLIDFMSRALNSIWGVKLDKMTIPTWLLSRVKYFSIILIFGFLWAVSIYLSSLINQNSGSPAINFLLAFLNNGIFLAIAVIFLVALLNILIAKPIPTKPLVIGSIFTTILISVGSFLISLYLRYSSPTSAYGAAGSILLLIVWINYVSQIFFFGVEITKSIVDFSVQNAGESGKNIQKPEIQKKLEENLGKLEKLIKFKKPNKNDKTNKSKKSKKNGKK